MKKLDLRRNISSKVLERALFLSHRKIFKLEIEKERLEIEVRKLKETLEDM